MPDINNISLPIKTVIAIVLWVGSMLGVWYAQDNRLKTVEDRQHRSDSLAVVKAAEFTKFKEDFKPYVIIYKVDELKTEVEGLKTIVDEVNVNTSDIHRYLFGNRP